MLTALLGTFVGLLLLLGAIQLYFDLRELTETANSDRYVFINKQVSIFNTLGMASGFTPEDIDSLEQLPQVLSVGTFAGNQFDVNASSSMFGFRTELFLEAVDSQYLDVHPENFTWQVGQKTLPVVVSRDYLALYNFGFAPSQGLPQFTPGTVKKVSVDVNVSGRGRRETFTGKIVGFSDRINSVLVPKSFMTWANQTFGRGNNGTVSRLILETLDPYHPDFQQFLTDRNYEISTGELVGGQTATLLRVLLAAVATIGLIISLLALIIFAQNFELLISRAAPDVRRLLQIGYRPTALSGLLVRKMMLRFVGVLLLALLVLSVLHWWLAGYLSQQAFDLSRPLHWWVWLTAGGLVLLFFGLNKGSVEGKVAKLA